MTYLFKTHLPNFSTHKTRMIDIRLKKSRIIKNLITRVKNNNNIQKQKNIKVNEDIIKVNEDIIKVDEKILIQKRFSLIELYKIAQDEPTRKNLKRLITTSLLKNLE